MIVALGSTRPAKIEAVRGAIFRIAEVDRHWLNADVVALEVQTSGPPMPLSDQELMRGARERAEAARELPLSDHRAADFYIGLEGGFHSVEIYGSRQTFLRGWAYATDGNRGAALEQAPLSSSPSRLQ